MTQWEDYKILRKVGRLHAICADSREGKEIIDLMTAMPAMEYANVLRNPNESTLYMLLSYAYALGIDSGKRQERQTARQKARVLA